MTHAVNVEAKDATRGRISLVKLMAGRPTVEIGTKYPDTSKRHGRRHTTELSAHSARALGSALLLAAAQIELAESVGAGDADGTGA